jgi:phenylacetate-CoA ligase
MGIDFRIRDFAYPLSILKLKRAFDNNQWLSEEALYQYQSAKLRQIIMHSYHHIPYYQKLFRENRIIPGDIQTVKDLKNIPFLTKDLLRQNFSSLVARDAGKYRAALLSTSGTTGGKLNFYVDKPSNVLEFVYYWRFWNWAGYKLGDTFAELAAEFFVFFKKNINRLYSFNRFSRRLTVNSLLISRTHLEGFISAFRKFKPLFLKGMPSNLYMLALVLNEKRNHGISFKGIFSQGENLLQYQRDFIEKVFSSRVFDSYGQMERTTAISQCPLGSYHIHPDYGITEFEDPDFPVGQKYSKDSCVKEIVGTSLYNLSMPLIRYRTGDLINLNHSPQTCSCGRGFPTVASIAGRNTDTIITSDRRAITALYTVFDRSPGIIMGQIIQEDINQLLVKIVSTSGDVDGTDRILMDKIRNFVGAAMDIKIEHVAMNEIQRDNLGKFKVVISNIPHEKILE